MDASHASWNPVEPRLAVATNGRVQVRDLDGKVEHEADAAGTRSSPGAPTGATLAGAGVDLPKARPAMPPAPGSGPLPADSKPTPPAPPTYRLTLWREGLSRKVEATAAGYAISRLAWSPDGRTLAATDDATACSGSGAPTAASSVASACPATASARSPGARISAYLASVTGGVTNASLNDPSRAPQHLDAIVLMWDRRGEPVGGFVGKGHDKAVFYVGWSPSREGNVLATAGAGRTVRLWTPRGEVPASPLRGHDGPVYQLHWAPDGHRFATVSADRTVRIWDVQFAKGEVLAEPLMTLAGPENRLPIVPSVRSTLYYAPTMQYPSAQMADPRIEVSHAPPDYGLTWRPDGLGIASVTGDPYARLWTTELADIYAIGKRRLITSRGPREGGGSPAHLGPALTGRPGSRSVIRSPDDARPRGPLARPARSRRRASPRPTAQGPRRS